MSNERVSPLTWLGIALAVAILLMAIFAALSLWAFGGSSRGYGMMGGEGWGWPVMVLGIPVVILIVVLIVVLVGLREPGPASVPPPSVTPLDTLNARYARSEISRDEYLRIRDDLTGPREER